jgi:hypothetical protein
LGLVRPAWSDIKARRHGSLGNRSTAFAAKAGDRQWESKDVRKDGGLMVDPDYIDFSAISAAKRQVDG